MPDPTPDCCKVWPRIIGQFDWHSFDEDEPTLLAMPYYLIGKDKYRVNHCPSCGANVRDCVVERERVLEAIQ